MCPGLTWTSAAEIVVAIGNIVLSTIFMDPPGVWVAFCWDKLNMKDWGVVPWGLVGAIGVCDGRSITAAGEWPSAKHSDNQKFISVPEGKIYNSAFGISLKADISTPKFLAITSLGTCASQSVRRNVSSSEKLPSSNTYWNDEKSVYIVQTTAYQEELCPIRITPSGLQGVRHTRWEIPKIARSLYKVRNTCSSDVHGRKQTTSPMKFWPSGVTAVTRVVPYMDRLAIGIGIIHLYLPSARMPTRNRKTRLIRVYYDISCTHLRCTMPVQLAVWY